ncbi:right-handed parallel beta-helix repeat-containing protein [Kribbella sp. NPDC055071]
MSHTREGSRALAATTALAVVLATTPIALAAPAGAAPAKATLHCGDTITTDTTLHADLVSCPGIGLAIGADHITLNLNGHTIDGNGVPADCGDDGPCDIGVANLDGHDDVTIVGGKIRQFAAGVFVAQHAARNRLGRLVVADTSDAGIIVVESTDSVIERNAVSGSSGFGIVLASLDDSAVERNAVDGNDQGIAIFGSSHHNSVRGNALTHQAGSALDLGEGATDNRLVDNRLADNGDGIVLQEAADNVVSRNVVTGTGSFGSPDTGGFGIVLDGADRNQLDRNTVTGGRGPAIFVATLDATTSPEGNLISRNTVNSKQYDGIFVDRSATATVIERNIANHNGTDGIHVDAPSTTVTRNVAGYNHNLGIETVPGVTDGGGNRAVHNGSRPQCTNIAC